MWCFCYIIPLVTIRLQCNFICKCIYALKYTYLCLERCLEDHELVVQVQACMSPESKFLFRKNYAKYEFFRNPLVSPTNVFPQSLHSAHPCLSFSRTTASSLNPPKLRSNYPRKQSIRPLDFWPPSYKSPKYVNITDKFPHFCFSCGTWETPLCNPFPAIQEQLVHVPPHWASVLLFPREPVLNTYKPKAFDKYAWTGVE